MDAFCCPPARVDRRPEPIPHPNKTDQPHTPLLYPHQPTGHFGSKLSHAVEFPQRIDFTPHCSLKYVRGKALWSVGWRMRMGHILNTQQYTYQSIQKREEHLKKVEGELFGVIVHQVCYVYVMSCVCWRRIPTCTSVYFRYRRLNSL